MMAFAMSVAVVTLITGIALFCRNVPDPHHSFFISLLAALDTEHAGVRTEFPQDKVVRARSA